MASNVKTYTYKGTCKWAKLFKPDQKYNTYQITLYPDKAGLKQYVKAGHQGEIREDEDGKYVVFRRKPQIPTKKGIWELGPPEVVDENNESLDKLVGNGSEVEVTVETYSTAAAGMGTRLAKVKVLELKEYNPDAGA